MARGRWLPREGDKVVTKVEYRFANITTRTPGRVEFVLYTEQRDPLCGVIFEGTGKLSYWYVSELRPMRCTKGEEE